MPVEVPTVLPPWGQVVRVAAAQRLLIWVFFAGFLAIPLSFFGAAAEARAMAFVTLVLITVRIAIAVALYRVAAELGSKVALLWAIGGFLPNIGLIVLLVLNSKATNFIRTAGQKPGFMGVKLPAEPPPSYGNEGLNQISS